MRGTNALIFIILIGFFSYPFSQDASSDTMPFSYAGGIFEDYLLGQTINRDKPCLISGAGSIPFTLPLGFTGQDFQRSLVNRFNLLAEKIEKVSLRYSSKSNKVSLKLYNIEF